MSVDPRRGHSKKQSWWKKDRGNSRRPKSQRNRTFKQQSNGNQQQQRDENSANSSVNNNDNDLQQQQEEKTNNNGSNQTVSNNNYGMDLLTSDPEQLNSRQIKTLQQELASKIKLNQQLEMELNLRASQVEQMEDNLRLVADQSKMIGVRAMEQEQKLLEIKKALQLKTKQLSLYRGSKADQIPLNEITVLPMHLRGKFSEFLRGVLLSQKRFFESALRKFIEESISDKELNYQLSDDKVLTRDGLLNEINKIGNSLALDYMSELELRLNGTFSPQQDTSYTLAKEASPMPSNNGNGGGYQQQPPSHQMIQQHRMNNNTLSATSGISQSIGPPMNNMNSGPHHTPMGSIGSAAGNMTPQTSISVDNSNYNNDNDTKGRKKVKTGGAFDKAKKLLKGRNKKKQQKQQDKQAQQQAAQQQAAQQQQYQQQMAAQQQQMNNQQQYPSPYGQANQQQYYHQYPSMNTPQGGQNGHGQHPAHHQFPPQPSMSSIPSGNNHNVGPQLSEATQRAQNAYSFHKSKTSVQKSHSNVAMETLMNEMAAMEAAEAGGGSHSPSRSGSVVVHDDDDDIRTDDDYTSEQDDDDDKKIDSTHEPQPNTVHPIAFAHDDDDEDDDDDQEDIDQFDGDALDMQKQLEALTRTHTQAILTKHGADGQGSNELNKMWSQFVQFKKDMDRPSDAPLAYTVPDKTSPFVELRDMLEALPFDLSYAILQEQQMNPYDRIKDVTLQRGCWPMIRFVKNNRVTQINRATRFDDVLSRLEMYLKGQKESGAPAMSQFNIPTPEEIDSIKGGDSKKSTITKPKKKPGRELLGSLDPQKTTGFRLHQITSVIRQRNEASHTITALNLRVGRLWNMDHRMEGDVIAESIDFFQSLESPSTMLLLGPNTAEKSALCREITKQLSSSPISWRTALVDTRSTVGGFTKSPIETGQSIRFYVNATTAQHHKINETRQIYPQVVVVDEVLSADDIEAIGKLQSEGISVIVGTNMHSLEALLGHPLYSQLLPPQDRLLSPSDLNPLNAMRGSSMQAHNRRLSYQYSSMSPHLLILEMNFDGTEVKMYKNIPGAVKAIKRFSQPEFTSYKLRWQGYNPTDTNTASKYMSNPAHKRTTSRMVNKLMKDTLSYKSLNIPTQL